jgi:hypothetical protein
MAQGEWESTTRLVEEAAAILAEQPPMTIRQRAAENSMVRRIWRNYA